MQLKDASAQGYGLDIKKLPTSMAAAAAVGSRYYFTGDPCPHGHVFARYTKGGRCVYCTRQQNARAAGLTFDGIGPRARKNMIRQAAASDGRKTYTPVDPCKHGHRHRYVASNNCVDCDISARAKRREGAKHARIKKLYGLTRDAHQALVAKQSSCCAICGSYSEDPFKLHIDHCHESGKVRGLLCSKCNQGIGLLGESEEVLASAARYLRNA